MTLLLRREKGDVLEHDEMDDNLVVLDNKMCFNTVNPTTTDDETRGIQIGSEWKNITSGLKYECVDATANSAIWELITIDIPTKTYSLLDLSDTPATYNGKSGYGLTVNDTEDGIEFFDMASLTNTMTVYTSDHGDHIFTPTVYNRDYSTLQMQINSYDFQSSGELLLQDDGYSGNNMVVGDNNTVSSGSYKFIIGSYITSSGSYGLFSGESITSSGHYNIAVGFNMNLGDSEHSLVLGGNSSNIVIGAIGSLIVGSSGCNGMTSVKSLCINNNDSTIDTISSIAITTSSDINSEYCINIGRYLTSKTVTDERISHSLNIGLKNETRASLSYAIGVECVTTKEGQFRLGLHPLNVPTNIFELGNGDYGAPSNILSISDSGVISSMISDSEYLKRNTITDVVTKAYSNRAMTGSEIDSIPNPIVGESVYNTEAKSPMYFDGTKWSLLSGGSGANNFLQLDDTPATYSQNGFLLRINQSTDGIEFVSPSLVAGGNLEKYGDGYKLAEQDSSFIGTLGVGAISLSHHNEYSGDADGATGESSITAGASCKADGLASIAMGDSCKAMGTRSIAMGYQSWALNNGCIMIGEGCRSTSDSAYYGVGIGSGNSVNQSSCGIGFSNSSGIKTYCFGNGNSTSGYNSIALGTKNSVVSSYALGTYNNISDIHNTVAGYKNTVSSKYSLCLGQYNTISEDYGVVIGRNNTSSGYNTQLFGSNLKSSGAYSTVIGQYNKQKYNSVFEVGIGSGDPYRKNALTVFHDGGAELESSIDTTEDLGFGAIINKDWSITKGLDVALTRPDIGEGFKVNKPVGYFTEDLLGEFKTALYTLDGDSSEANNLYTATETNITYDNTIMGRQCAVFSGDSKLQVNDFYGSSYVCSFYFRRASIPDTTEYVYTEGKDSVDIGIHILINTDGTLTLSHGDYVLDSGGVFSHTTREDVVTSNNYCDGEWHHVVCMRSLYQFPNVPSSQVENIYVNQEMLSSYTRTNGSYMKNPNVFGQSLSDTNGFNGELAYIRITKDDQDRNTNVYKNDIIHCDEYGIVKCSREFWSYSDEYLDGKTLRYIENKGVFVPIETHEGSHVVVGVPDSSDNQTRGYFTGAIRVDPDTSTMYVCVSSDDVTATWITMGNGSPAPISYDGGDSSTTLYDTTVDGGDSSTTSYDTTVDGGDSTTTY